MKMAELLTLKTYPFSLKRNLPLPRTKPAGPFQLALYNCQYSACKIMILAYSKYSVHFVSFFCKYISAVLILFLCLTINHSVLSKIVQI